MTRKAFVRHVHEGAARIPEKFRGYLKDVAVVVEMEPTAAQRRAAGVGRGSDLLGLYEGTPRTKREYLPYRLPEKITLFQRPVERSCGGDTERIREEVAHTIWHELAHALGMPETQVRRLERRRRARPAKNLLSSKKADSWKKSEGGRG